MLSSNSQMFKINNFIVAIDTINKSTISKRSINIFENKNLAGVDGELSNVTFPAFNNYIEQNKKLPKFWSFKDGMLIHKIGTFCFSSEKFMEELSLIINNIH